MIDISNILLYEIDFQTSYTDVTRRNHNARVKKAELVFILEREIFESCNNVNEINKFRKVVINVKPVNSLLLQGTWVNT